MPVPDGNPGMPPSLNVSLVLKRLFHYSDAMTSLTWLLLTYKVPPEPSAKRLALWRKLKGMGAVYLQNGVCLLPKTDDHVRRLKMLANDAVEMGGDAVLLETVALDRSQEERVVARFKADRDEQYLEFLDKCADFEAEIAKETAAEHFTYAELEENDVDLKKLQGWLEKIGKLDFYGATQADQAAERLRGCETLLDAYAQRVFDAHDENK
ncbi:chromate resistance protein ChrB [Bosea minatitlanensis]